MHSLANAMVIHAQADDLKFLNRVRNRVGKVLGKYCKSFELGNQKSHAEAALALKRFSKGLVIIFAHGGSDYLRGGEYLSRLTGERVEVERFLTRETLDSFSGKAVFCLSCDSNGLSGSALHAGAIGFVGFDEIPFNRFDKDGNAIGTQVLVKHSQELIAVSVLATLELFLSGRVTLAQSVEYFRLSIDQRAVRYVKENPRVAERRDVAALSLRVKDGVRYQGEMDVRFVLGGAT